MLGSRRSACRDIRERLAFAPTGRHAQRLGVYSGKLQVPYDAFAAGLGDYRIVTTLCPGGKERMRRLMSMVQSGRFDPTPLITHRFSLDQIVEAYDLFRFAARRCSESGDPALMSRPSLPRQSPTRPRVDPLAQPLIKRFDEIGIEDIPLVGGKNASLGEMRRELTAKGVPVPDGFATTAPLTGIFWRRPSLKQLIEESLGDLDVADIHELQKRERENPRGDRVREAALQDCEQQIRAGYEQLCARSGEMVAVAVRSSATAEDLPDASFAGAQETFLNVLGEEALYAACLRCFASLFTDRAISYRADKGYAHTKVALSIGIQRMVRSDLAHFRRHLHASIPRLDFATRC